MARHAPERFSSRLLALRSESSPVRFMLALALLSAARESGGANAATNRTEHVQITMQIFSRSIAAFERRPDALASPMFPQRILVPLTSEQLNAVGARVRQGRSLVA